MSRPPRPHYRVSTTAPQDGRRDRLDYLPLAFPDFVDLERTLAADELGVATGDAEGDFARTLMEASAAVAQILGVYQNLYAREGFLSTARSPVSLVRHARRLAYEPDRGLSATGYALLTVGDDLAGVLPAGFALASVPRGEVPAQTYETLEPLAVRAEWNELAPRDATLPATLSFDAAGRATLRLEGSGHGLEPGQPALLAGPAAHQRYGVRIEKIDESGGVTFATVRGDTTPAAGSVLAAAGWRLLGHPLARLHPFGWNADPERFPPAEIAGTTFPYNPPSTAQTVGFTRFGFRSPFSNLDVYLSEETPVPLLGRWVLQAAGGALRPLRAAGESLATPVFVRGEVTGFDQPLFEPDGTPQIDTDGTVKTTTFKRVTESRLTGTVTAWRLFDPAGFAVSRNDLAFPSLFLGDFELDLPLAATRPNPAPATQPLAIDSDLSELRPGRLLVLGHRDGSRARVAEVAKVEPAPGGGSLLSWNEVTPADPGAPPLSLSELRVRANVATLGHGETVTEILGASDGVTPFQRFTLKKSPVTLLPGADGGEPAIEVRVNDLAWTRVGDFYDSGREDRHYRLEVDDEGTTTVVFGDGRRGAVPPAATSGKPNAKNLVAVYKIGLGPEGDAAAGRVARMKKAHPLIDRALNPVPVAGGAPPAALEDVRRQATRHVITFDRAVSVRDHADLALLFPGVVRASGSWSETGGIELVIADAAGEAPAAKDAIRAFLDARRDTGIPLALHDPQPVDVRLALTVEHDPAHLPETVRRAVQDALLGATAEAASGDGADDAAPGLFTFAARDLGQAAHLSEVHARVAEVPGVDFVRVTAFHLDAEAPPPGAPVRDVILAGPRQWLRLLPDRSSVIAAPREGSS